MPQLWGTNELGGYMHSVNLSRKLRLSLQPMTRFRQFADCREAFGLGKGATFNWNVYSDVQDEGGILDETETMPESNFEIAQQTLEVTEYGNSVPFSHKLDNLSEHPVVEVINKVLKHDARKALDNSAVAQFDLTKLHATSTSATAFTLTTNGAPAGAHTDELTHEHVKVMADTMEERNIPVFDGENYMAIGRPTALRQLKNDLEAVHQYVSEGWQVIMNGEKGRAEGIRFIQQTNVPAAGYANSDDIYFFGADTVVEAISIPEEIRGKIPTDYGRSHGIAWYAILGYGIVHTDAAQSRIIKWSSTG